MSTRRNKFLHHAGRPVVYVLLAAAALLYVAARYKTELFANATLSEILFYVFNGLEGMATTSTVEAVQDNLILFFVVFGLLAIPVVDFYRNKIKLHFYFGRKRRREIVWNPSNIKVRYKLAYAGVVFLVALGYGLSTVGAYEYAKAALASTNLYAKEYVNPAEVDIEFPEKKRNLIYIYLESMENTLLSRENGGMSDISQIPELEKIAQNNLSFSHTNKLGGALPVDGTTWTVGAMTAQSAGVPLKTVLGLGSNEMGNLQKFLPGAHTLGDVLQAEGYNQMLMVGSRAEFGGRDKLFQQHGNYEIFDLDTARQKGLIPQDYHVWWGYEDRRLFNYAKTEIKRLAAQKEPFNFQMLTVDTHFVDGYLDPTCPTPFKQQYENVYNCSSARVAALLGWIKQQDFYDNTTIVITGDHLGMQTKFYDKLIGKNTNYQRTIYNSFINSAAETDNTKKRLFSSFDMYPTTLAAMGADISGDRLALGVNLFSDKPTLLETYGLEKLNDELTKHSQFYETNILLGR